MQSDAGLVDSVPVLKAEVGTQKCLQEVARGPFKSAPRTEASIIHFFSGFRSSQEHPAGIFGRQIPGLQELKDREIPDQEIISPDLA